MKKVSDEKALLKGLVSFIADHFGDEVEIVLHDFDKKQNVNSIVDIRNGHITGRKIGDGVAKHGIQAIPGEDCDGNIIHEIIYTERGTILKCSDFFIKDSDGQVIGIICINQDITNSVKYQNYLQKQNAFQIKESSSIDVNEVLANVIQEAFMFIGKHPSVMTKEDRVAFIRYLDDKGTFLISKSGPKICETLNISKFTLYNYLDIIRNSGDNN